ncbi:cytochrome P450 [Aureisphaera galaxeae]|uniref:cytochrome P450 n=1 Tax=Aureisphaera galaxeae TaxID=1538023 RepID=UPI0023505D84|nr:cytochrome P450 [Aureisphaera galaxeae]MDC8005263.1 cytochrome P450 [Aureisphaera galaxeae]
MSKLTQPKFVTDYYYDRRVPTLACNSVNGEGEIARWVMDLHQILRVNNNHSPQLSVGALEKMTKDSTAKDAPVLCMTDVTLYTAESIIRHYDSDVDEVQKLFPIKDTQRLNEVEDLYGLFTGPLQKAVLQYFYSELFSSKKNALSLMTKGVPASESSKWKMEYGSLKKKLFQQFGIGDQDSVVFLVEVQKIFTQVNDLLKDGRRYLTGDSISAADVAFAACAAPVLLPVEFQGSLPKFNEISEELRQEIMDLRATPAGQFALHLYQEDRPINLDLGAPPKYPNAFKRGLNKLLIKLTSNQGKVFYFLQKRFPVLRIGVAKIAAVSRHDLVVEVLDRDLDFTIKEINAKKMANQKGTFFLGMDRNNPQFDRERNYVRAATHKDDLEMIRKYVREHADAICERVQSYGKLDVVQTLNYNVLLGLLGYYFGVPAPVDSQMKRWQRTMFYDLFLNFTNNPEKHHAAVQSGKERTAWVRGLISERKQALANGQEIDDNLLNRLIKMQQQEEYNWVDDDTIRRNIGGLLTGIQETTSKAVIYALQELFKRPEVLKGAIEASKARDMDTVKGYVYEALRFNPVQPGVLRFSETKQILKGAGKKTYTIKGNRRIMALTSGAMFDPVTFPEPKKFKHDRNSRYMNWGFALHECYGKYINSVTIPELVTAVLRLENVSLSKGTLGRGSGLTMGPFPNNYVVTFNKKTTTN